MAYLYGGMGLMLLMLLMMGFVWATLRMKKGRFAICSEAAFYSRLYCFIIFCI